MWISLMLIYGIIGLGISAWGIWDEYKNNIAITVNDCVCAVLMLVFGTALWPLILGMAYKDYIADVVIWKRKEK